MDTRGLDRSSKGVDAGAISSRTEEASIEPISAERAMTEPAPFTGFREETFRFLRGITKNDDKEWFDAHR